MEIIFNFKDFIGQLFIELFVDKLGLIDIESLLNFIVSLD